MKLGIMPNQVAVCAPAKINLHLEILGKRSDGFHELETVMSTIDLCDQLHFALRGDDQINLQLKFPSLTADDVALPTDDRNLVVKAFKLLREKASSRSSKTLGCDVRLFKRIPSQAGLGGASSDAAATLRAGNELWQLGLSRLQLLNLAAELGSDVPFFLEGGTAICRGRGELVEALRSPGGTPLVVAKPPVGLSTPTVFQHCEISSTPVSPQSCVSSVQTGDRTAIATALFNRLESTAGKLAAEVARMSAEFEMVNCPGHQMSGSGTSYFGVFHSVRTARRAAHVLSCRLPRARILYCRTLGFERRLVA